MFLMEKLDNIQSWISFELKGYLFLCSDTLDKLKTFSLGFLPLG